MKLPTDLQTLTLLVLLLVPLAGSAAASETQTHDFVALGAPQFVPTTTVCPFGEGDHDDDHLIRGAPVVSLGEEEDRLCLGGYEAHAEEGVWEAYTASIQDDTFDAPYLSVCIVPDDGHDDHAGDIHLFCGDDDGETLFFTGCGTVSVPAGSGVTFDEDTVVQGLVATLHLDTDTFDTCLGSAGHVVSVFS